MESKAAKIIVFNSDWKENVEFGRGPIEDSSFIHNTSACSVYGTIIKYIHPKHKKIAFIEVAAFSAALDKSSLAAIKQERNILNHVLKEEPDFKEAWDDSDEVIGFFDRGKHYDSEEFFYNRLVDWPKQNQKIYRLQLLEGGHGM